MTRGTCRAARGHMQGSEGAHAGGPREKAEGMHGFEEDPKAHDLSQKESLVSPHTLGMYQRSAM